MGAPDGKLSKSEPRKNEPAKDTPQDVGAAPSGRATEVPDPPWKRKPRRDVFEGDVAVVELRSRLAPERIPEPAVRFSTAPTFSGVLPLMSGVVMAGAVAGVAGYLWGSKLSTEMPELTPASSQADVLPAPSTPVASLKTSNRDFDPPAAARTASIGLSPVATGGAPNPGTSVDAAQRPALLPPQTVSPTVAARPPVAAEDASVIA